MARRSFLEAAATITAKTAAGQQFPQPPVRYPDPAVEALDSRFRALTAGSAAVELLYRGTRWGEGPVWFGDGRYLLWRVIAKHKESLSLW